MMQTKPSLLNIHKASSNLSKSPHAAISSNIYNTQNTKSKKDIGQPYRVVNIELAPPVKKASRPISIDQALGKGKAQDPG